MRQHQLLTLVAVSLAVCDAQQLLPRFKAPARILEPGDYQTWSSHQPSSILFLVVPGDVLLQVQLEGGSCTNEMQVLKYKCPGSSVEEKLSITYLWPFTKLVLCYASSVPVQVTKKVDEIVLKAASLSTAHLRTMDYTRIFTKLLEMKVEVKCKERIFNSNSLSIVSMVVLESLNTSSRRRFGLDYQTRILTDAGVRFLATMDLENQEFGSVDLIDPTIIDLVNKAPDWIKTKITVNAYICLGCGRCTGSHPYSSITFSTDSIRMAYGFIITTYLNTADGKLHYSTYAISKFVSDIVEGALDRRGRIAVHLCARIGISGLGLDKTIPLPINNSPFFIQKDSNPYKRQGTPSSNCKVIANAPKTFTMLSGSDVYYITCPIVCSHEARFHFKKKRSPAADVEMIPSASAEWRCFYPGMCIYRSGKFLEFPFRVSASHSGQYSCHAGSASFDFTVIVVSVPHFQTPLPDRIFAMEGSSINFSCVSAFNNINSVTVTPQFHTNQVDLTNPTWKQLSLDEFNTLLGSSGQAELRVKLSSDTNKKSLTLSVSSVPAATAIGRNISHTLVCNASVGASEASSKLGMPSYSAQTNSDVLFVPRPTMRHFSVSTVDCSDAQRCKAEKGERFAVSLQPELSSYLNAIGVEVDADFRVGNSRLEEVLRNPDELSSSSRYSISFNSTSHSLVFTVNPITDQDLLKKLSNMTVTPVFNFRYNRRWNLRNLKFSVDSEKSELMADRKCSFDNRCFYSTDFHIGAELTGLQFFVNF